MSGEGPSSNEDPQVLGVRHSTMSVLRTQCPHVHQHSVSLLTRGRLLASWQFEPSTPYSCGLISGMTTPESRTCWIHLMTWGFVVSGTMSAAG